MERIASVLGKGAEKEKDHLLLGPPHPPMAFGYSRPCIPFFKTPKKQYGFITTLADPPTPRWQKAILSLHPSLSLC